MTGFQRCAYAGLMFLVWFCVGHALRGQEAEIVDVSPRVWHVPAEGSSSGKGFEVTELPLRRSARHRVLTWQYASPVVSDVPENNLVPAEYYQPLDVADGQPPRPAVVCLHILNGNFELVRLLCTVLADNGIPAMMFKLPYYGERSPPGGRRVLLTNADLFAGALEQALADIRRAVDVLSSRAEVDAGKIGIAGISLGAILGGTACEVEPRLSRSLLILGGGNLRHILMTAREARGMRAFVDGLPAAERDALLARLDALDPLNRPQGLQRLAQQDALLMINATDDEVVPRSCTEALAEAVGVSDRVVWFEGLGHYTAMASLPELLRLTTEFFAADMPPGDWAPQPSPGPPAPLAVLSGILQQLVTVMGVPVEEGRCHVIDCDVRLSKGPLAKSPGRVRFLRGSAGRFLLDCPVPEVGRLLAGQGDTAWLSGGREVVFVGDQEMLAGQGPMRFATMRELMKLRMALGVLAGLAAAPDAFAQYVTVTPGAATASERSSLKVELQQKQFRGEGTLELAADGRTPQRILLGTDGHDGEIVVRQWLVNTVAHEALFAPPADLVPHSVRQEDVCRMLAAIFDFAMENL